VNVVGTRDPFASRQTRQLVSEIKESYWQWMERRSRRKVRTAVEQVQLGLARLKS
jgi:hypothetical protein